MMVIAAQRDQVRIWDVRERLQTVSTTKAQLEAIREAIDEVLADDNPMSVRGLFYALTTRGVIVKDEAEYSTVKRLTAAMRRSGRLPYSWLADATRWMRKPDTYSSVEQALRRTAESYRRALWDDAPVAVELWVEKEALAGVLVDVTDEWDVPLMVTRGYPSMSFLHSAAEAIYERGKRGRQTTAIYYLGDHDPSGRDIDRAIRQGIGESLMSLEKAATAMSMKKALATGMSMKKALATGDPRWLNRMMFDAEDAEMREEAFADYASFERVAVTQQQITAWNLPTRPTKKKQTTGPMKKGEDPRSKRFKGDSVELDAIPAHQLRTLARQAIEHHVDQHQLDVLRTYEEEERAGLERLAATFNGEPPGGESS